MKLIAALAIFASVSSAAATESKFRGRKLSSSSSDVSVSCATFNGSEVEFETSWDLEAETAVSYPCSTGYLSNFAANPNLLDDLMDAVGPCFKYCNIDNGGYSGSNAMGSGDLSDLFDDDGKTCDAIAANPSDSTDSAYVKGPTSCDCGPADISGCSMCYGIVKATITSCYDVIPN